MCAISQNLPQKSQFGAARRGKGELLAAENGDKAGKKSKAWWEGGSARPKENKELR